MELALVIEEPDRRRLWDAALADGRENCRRGFEEVVVGLRKIAHICSLALNAVLSSRLRALSSRQPWPRRSGMAMTVKRFARAVAIPVRRAARSRARRYRCRSGVDGRSAP